MSALSVLFGIGRPVGPVLLGAGAVAAIAVFIAARFDRPPGDVVVAELDHAASLDGTLRSAHWFASNEHRGSESGPGAAWVAFHVETAALRADGADWAAIYARPSAARSWLATAALSAATIGVLALESPHLSLPFSTPVEERSDGTIVAIPPNLVGQVLEGMKAMQAGTRPSKEALSAFGQALEIAKHDPLARRQLESLFANAGGDSVFGEDWDVAEMPWGDDTTAAPEWAYDEVMARTNLKEEPPAAGQGPPSPDDASGATRVGEIDRGLTAALRPDSVVVQADTRGQAGSFSSLLFGKQQAKGEAGATPSSAASSAAAAALAAALRREVVHARSDIPDANRVLTGRRAPDMGRGPDSGTAVEPTGVSYDASNAGRPPAVPDARRRLLHDFFVRPADPAPVANPQ